MPQIQDPAHKLTVHCLAYAWSCGYRFPVFLQMWEMLPWIR